MILQSNAHHHLPEVAHAPNNSEVAGRVHEDVGLSRCAADSNPL